MNSLEQDVQLMSPQQEAARRPLLSRSEFWGALGSVTLSIGIAEAAIEHPHTNGAGLVLIGSAIAFAQAIDIYKADQHSAANNAN